MATGIVTWSQTAASNATADTSVNWAEGQAPSSVNDSARAAMASTAKWRDDNNGSITTGGSSTAYTITSNQVFAALTADYVIAFAPHTTSGATVTLNVDSLGAKPLRSAPGVELPSGALIQGTPYTATYYASNSGEWILHGNIGVPAGAMFPYAGSSAPGGYLLCDGSSVLRASYPALFVAIGTTYGSADGSHFTLPDPTGRVIAGKEATATRLTSAVSGVDGGTLGASGGSQSHTLTTAELAAHTHGITDPGHTHTALRKLSGDFTTADGTGTVHFFNDNSSTSSSTTGISLANAGSDGAHANVQPTLVLNYIIKT